MKAYKSIRLMLIILIVSTGLTFAQSSSNNNNCSPSGKFLGWGTTSCDLPFKTNNVIRMTLQNNTGWLGLGLTAPQSLLHLHNSAVPNANTPQVVYSQWTIDGPGTGTGNTANDGFRIGVRSFFNTNISAFESQAQLIQQENAPMVFYSNGPNTGIQERIKITHGTGFATSNTYPNTTRVNISYGAGFSPIITPVAMLNLGLEPPVSPPQIGGQRVWMDVGTFMGLNTDNMYVGLKNESNAIGEGNDRVDAVVNWGDNIGTPLGPDNLRFIFTAPFNLPGSGIAGTTNGLEVARMITTPGGDRGRMGVGNFFATGVLINPQRRLEVLDNGEGAPQLRLTFTQNAIVNRGVFTDFQTTSFGHLAILPFNSGNPVPQRPTFVGIQTITPGNTLEINSRALNTNQSFAGLRFTDLRSTSPTLASNNKVLSVDASGDVILVPDQTGQFTPECNLPAVNLNDDWRIALNTHNYYYDGIGVIGTNSVLIGFNCGDVPKAKLYVRARLDAPFNIPGIINVAGRFEAAAGGLAEPIDVNIAGLFLTDQGDAKPNTNYGVYAWGRNASNVNYGIYATATGTGATNYAGYFDGDVFVNSPTLGTMGLVGASDVMFKTNIDAIANAQDIISQLKPVTFFYDTTNQYGLNFSGKRQYGFTVQDLEQFLPELVGTLTQPAKYDSLGNMIHPAVTFKTLNENAFSGIIIAAMQQQQQQIDSLTTLVAQNNSAPPMMNQGNNNGTNNQSINQHFVELEGLDKPFLSQNRPNPFSGQTEIDYYIPNESATDAHILFYDQLGRMLKDEPLKAGFGTVTVNTRDLPAGVYTYKLLINGQVLDTKKMVYQK